MVSFLRAGHILSMIKRSLGRLARTMTVTENVTITPSPIRSVINSDINSNDSKASNNETNASVLATLGVFLCLLVIALTAVSIGWIWTFCAMKKKLSQKARKIYIHVHTIQKIGMILYNEVNCDL